MTGTASPARKATRWTDCRSDNSTSCSNCPDRWFACCYLRLDQHDDVCCKCSWCKWDWSKNGIRSSVCPIEHDETFRNTTEYYLKVSRRCTYLHSSKPSECHGHRYSQRYHWCVE
jgi:hypothetical protein